MKIKEFDPDELRVVGEQRGMMGSTPILNYPYTAREAMHMMYAKHAPWAINSITDVTSKMFAPRCNPDNIARGFVFDGTTVPGFKYTKADDMFGLEWVYVPEVGGSIVRPGSPMIEDVDELATKIVWPDVDSWDWEGCRKANEEFLADKDKSVCFWFLNGYFERLIAFMDFENAIVALIDEEQQDQVHAFFDKLADLYIEIFKRVMKWFPEVDIFYIHDDWGSQRASFFSPATAEEMIVPYMKKVNDFLHANGKICHFHSCGHLMNMVPNMIAAGWDAWDGMPMNDSNALWEQFGDQIALGLTTPTVPEGATEEEIRKMADDFVDHYCLPGEKYFMIGMYGRNNNPIFNNELYIASRKKMAGFEY